MERAKIRETNLHFGRLFKRWRTDFIVIHHTGVAGDWSAYDIHDWHLNNDWAGCGYHFIIRENGNIERGRPVDTIGSHAYGFNSESIGIHLSGEFSIVKPTRAQIESVSMLVANLCYDYDIPIDRQHILGHYELNSTACPGKMVNLTEIVGKANFYRYH